MRGGKKENLLIEVRKNLYLLREVKVRKNQLPVEGGKREPVTVKGAKKELAPVE